MEANQKEEKKIESQIKVLYEICPEKPTTPIIKGYDFNKGVDY